MVRLLSGSDRDGRTGGGHNFQSMRSMPWWVKAFGIVAAVLVLLVVILHLTGHSPGGYMHMPAVNSKDHGVQKP